MIFFFLLRHIQVNLVGSAADAGKVFLESSVVIHYLILYNAFRKISHYFNFQVSSVGSTASEILTRTTVEVGTQITEQASALTSTIQTSIEDAGTPLIVYIYARSTD